MTESDIKLVLSGALSAAQQRGPGATEQATFNAITVWAALAVERERSPHAMILHADGTLS